MWGGIVVFAGGPLKSSAYENRFFAGGAVKRSAYKKVDDIKNVTAYHQNR
jgi:hypothetical protein